jgi:subtilisin family serine protease
VIVTLLAVAFSAVGPASAQPSFKRGGEIRGPVEESPNGVYIVQMINDPVIAYTGDVPGFSATKPPKGQKINPDNANVTKYVQYLNNKHNEALSKVGGEKLYDYVYSFNGFAAKMSLQQANKLNVMDGVLLVSPDVLHAAQTSSTPSFLGLDAPGGLWEQLGGVGSAGENIIIGIIDTGIWPESLSFSDRVDENGIPSATGRRVYGKISGWRGLCQNGEMFSKSDCNNKLIGAMRFNQSWGGDKGINLQRPWEFTSPRDYNGHGTHTAATAGGNYNVPTDGPAAAFGSVSGIAPRARIAAYKALWSTEDASTASGFTGDLVAAIDRAVADGVDVINYSISGTSTEFLDPVEIAFLFAADAGVFVSASAGNSGPDASTVAHTSPWITTVAASTHDRPTIGSVTLGNGEEYEGATVATASVTAPLVDSEDAGLAGADPDEVRLCFVGTLDPAIVTGKIVLCERGVNARVDKSLAVQMAGGVGMILVNPSPNSLNADLHFVPTVHLSDEHYAAVKAYANTPCATATINPAFASAPAPAIAEFSSRGPLLAGEGDLLKPDISAPGVDILAAVAPPGNAGRNFNIYSGTSMAAPHVAGLAALLLDLHPDWSPMMIKSALMTTGTDLVSGADPFAQGAGHVAPNSAADPGLVYDHGFLDWLAFLCGTTDGVDPADCEFLEMDLGFSLDPSDLNVASFAIGSLAGTQTVERTVTNVSDVSETYEFSYSLPGVDVVADPSSFTLAPWESATYTLTFTVTSAAPDAYVTGFVHWTGDQGHVVRSPVAVLPEAIVAPGEVMGSGTEGSLMFDVTFGYTGPYTAAPHGLVAAETQTGTVADDPSDDIDVALGTCDFGTFPFECVGITWHEVSVPAGTMYTRISLFDAYTDGADDLDLYVFDSELNFVGGSGSGTSAEEVNIPSPSDTVYLVAVHGWGTDGPDANYTLFNWSIPAAPGSSNMTISGAPASVTLGDTATLTVSWSGLAAGTKYLGAVSHNDASGMLDLTIVAVATD